MKTKLVFILGIVLLYACSEVNNKTFTNEKNGKKELIGTCTRSGFDQKEFAAWFKPEYESYMPDAETIEKLKKHSFKKIGIKIIFGTWCGDSRREMPRFYKIKDMANMPENSISLTAVDSDKNSGDSALKNIEFTRIPTFIFYKKGKEIGRIVESCEASLEKDMLAILEKE